MGQQFEYDERGSTFYYFLVSFYALILLPITYYFSPWRLFGSSSKSDKADDNKRCRCIPCLQKDEAKKASEPQKRLRNYLLSFIVIVGWIGFAFLIYKAAHAEFEVHEYDPYAILELDREASIEDVKRQYRKLSMKHHPDRGGDPVLFVAITKAHQALTNEESMENWKKYGNPDGPGALRFGIALPSWLVSKEYSFFVLAAYGLLLMVVLPTAVGVWWYRSIKYSADQVLMDTSRLYSSLLYRSSLANVKKLLMIMSASFEFSKQYNKDIVERPTDNVEVPQLISELGSFQDTKKDVPLCYPYSQKARALVFSYLSRMKLSSIHLERDRCYILRKTQILIPEMIQMFVQLTYYCQHGRTQRMPALETLENMFKLSPLIIQALWDHKSSLYELPHFQEDTVRFCYNKKKIRNCTELARLSDDERASLLRGLSKQELQDISNVLASRPRVEMNVSVEVEDDDEKHKVTASAVVTVIVKLKRTPLMELSSSKLFSSTSNHLQAQVASHSANDGETDDDTNEGINGETGDVETLQPETAPQLPQRKPWEKQKKNKKAAKKKKQAVQNKRAAAVRKQSDDEEDDAQEGQDSKEKESGDQSADKSDSEGSDDESVKNAKPNAADEDDDLAFEDITRNNKILEAKSKVTHEVHCPYFPDTKYEWWWIYVCDRKSRRMTCAPVQVTTLVTEEEVQLKFVAPPKKGMYTYQVCLRSDSYTDMEINKDIKIQVHEAKQFVSHPQWDFPSEDEEHKSEQDASDVSEYTEEEEEAGDNSD